MKTAGLISFVLALCSVTATLNESVDGRSPPTSGSKHLRFEPFHGAHQNQDNPIGGSNKRTRTPGYISHTFLPTHRITDHPPGNINQYTGSGGSSVLTKEPTDSGTVHNLKWRFSDSSIRRLPGGWVREQVITDLPSSHDIAGAQQHLAKGSIREPH